MNYYIGIDIGGTFIKYGIVDEKGSVLHKGKVETTTSAEEIKNNILNVIKLYKEYSIYGVGISVPGVINNKGIMKTAGAIKEFVGINLKKEMEEFLNLPVKVINDANAVAAAEKWIGNAKDYTDFVCITLGTAVGGTIYINDKIYKGFGGLAGEFGVSLMGRSKDYKEESTSMHAGVVAGLCRKYSTEKREYVLDAQEILRRRDNGDALAKECIENFYHDVAILLVNVSVIVNPEIIFIGGGISSNKVVMEEIKKEYEKLKEAYHVLTLVDMPKIEPCLLENDAGIVGAVSLFHTNN